MSSAAAFFDLDKTLIEGSSAIHFARASYRRGLMSRRELASGLWANVKFRLRGSTDEETDALRERRAAAIREVAEREGYDLSESWAYSDSESDLPMLRAVGHPVAVNPDAELRRVAREEDWEIMHFDKLHRRLRVASIVGAAGLVAAGTGYAATRAT